MLRTRSALLALGCMLTCSLSLAGPLPVTTGLQLHLDSSNIDGNGGAPSDGSPVTSWSDLSGQGHDATSIGTVAPVYAASGINGWGAVDFSLSNADVLATAASSDFAGPNATMFLVAADPVTALVSMAELGSWENEMLLYARGGPNMRSFHHTSSGRFYELPHQNDVSGGFIQEAVFGQAVTDLSNTINGVATTMSGSTSGSPAPYPASTNRAVYVGRRGNPGGENGAGLVAELLIYDRQLSAVERDLVGSYLANKYNIATQYSGVPEPSSLVLVGLLAAPLVWRCRRAGR